MKDYRNTLPFAQADLEISKLILSLNNQSIHILGGILFHSHQCAEKILKCYLLCKGIEFKNTHDLNKLIWKCTTLDHEFSLLTKDTGFLNPVYSNARYYNPKFKMPQNSIEAFNYFSSAKFIFDFVKNKLN